MLYWNTSPNSIQNLVLYPCSVLCGKIIFVIRSVQLNQESTSSRFLHIIQMNLVYRKSYAIHQIITRHLDLCQVGHHASLLVDTVAESQSQLMQATCVSDETYYRVFNSKFLNGNIYVPVRGTHIQGQVGVLKPNNTNSNTGRPVMGMMKEKHPKLRTPDLSNPVCTSFKH